MVKVIIHTKSRIYLFSPTRLKNSIKHEYSCTILYTHLNGRYTKVLLNEMYLKYSDTFPQCQGQCMITISSQLLKMGK